MKRTADKLDATFLRDDPINAELWSPEECHRRLGVRFPCAYYDPKGANFNPYRLASGILQRGVLPLGVLVHEHAVAKNVSRNSEEGWVVDVMDANDPSSTRTIKAKNLVYATNAY